MDGTGAALSKPKKPRVDTIKNIAARLGGITKADIESPCRKKEFTIPRTAAMYVAREHTDCSFPQIGRMFGDRDHSTVLLACRKATHVLTTNPGIGTSERRLIELIEGIKQELERSRAEPTHETAAVLAT